MPLIKYFPFKIMCESTITYFNKSSARNTNYSTIIIYKFSQKTKQGHISKYLHFKNSRINKMDLLLRNCSAVDRAGGLLAFINSFRHSHSTTFFRTQFSRQPLCWKIQCKTEVRQSRVNLGFW